MVSETSGTIRPRASVGLMVALAVVLVVGLFNSVPASSADAVYGGNVTAASDNQPCLDNVGITVVVDFRELGGGVNVRCAPGPVTDGFDALTKAGVSFQTTRRFGGFLCKIAGLPADDPCINTSPDDAYWSYWIAPRGGQWCYANLGAGNRSRPLPPGSIEGWSFSKDKQSTTNAPPRYRPPAAIPGQAPNPIATSDCNGAVPLPPSPPPSTVPTTTPTANGPESTGGVSGGGSNGAGSAGPAPQAQTGPVEPGSGPDAPGVPDAETSTTVAGEVAVETQVQENGADGEVALGLVRSNDDGSTEALGDVDLADNGSRGGSLIAYALVGLAVIGFGVGGTVMVRRRRAAGVP